MAKPKVAPGLLRLAEAENNIRPISPARQIIRPVIEIDSVLAETQELEAFSLDQLATEIRNRRHRQVADTILIGAALTVAKSRLQHGEWEPWLSSVGYSTRTAQRDMQVARAAFELRQRQNANLRFSSAKELLSLAQAQGVLPSRSVSHSDRYAKLKTILREHHWKVPMDMCCSCGAQFLANNYETGLDAWVDHVVAILVG